MDTDICNHIKNLELKQNFRRKRGRKKYAPESGTIIMDENKKSLLNILLWLKSISAPSGNQTWCLSYSGWAP